MPAYVAAFEHAFVFSHPGELLFGTGLLYYSRLFERQVSLPGCAWLCLRPAPPQPLALQWYRLQSLAAAVQNGDLRGGQLGHKERLQPCNRAGGCIAYGSC